MVNRPSGWPEGRLPIALTCPTPSANQVKRIRFLAHRGPSRSLPGGSAGVGSLSANQSSSNLGYRLRTLPISVSSLLDLVRVLQPSFMRDHCSTFARSSLDIVEINARLQNQASPLTVTTWSGTSRSIRGPIGLEVYPYQYLLRYLNAVRRTKNGSHNPNRWPN